MFQYLVDVGPICPFPSSIPYSVHKNMTGNAPFFPIKHNLLVLLRMVILCESKSVYCNKFSSVSKNNETDM